MALQHESKSSINMGPVEQLQHAQIKGEREIQRESGKLREILRRGRHPPTRAHKYIQYTRHIHRHRERERESGHNTYTFTYIGGKLTHTYIY